jgi:hypothetical protein
MAEEEGDAPEYVVGYRRPPRATQFKPGQSGNPNGRPKGAKNFATALRTELDARVTITENGKRRTVSKREVIAKQVVNKAAAGDPRAIPILFNEIRPVEQEADAGSPTSAFGRPEDRVVMEHLLRRLHDSEPILSDAQSADAGATDGPGGPPAAAIAADVAPHKAGSEQ